MADSVVKAVPNITAGQPMRFKSPQELSDLVSKYFGSLQEGEHPTISGLASFIGINRQTLLNYKTNYGLEFGAVFNQAKSFIEGHLEQCLMGGSNPIGKIFILKNNYGWSEGLPDDSQKAARSINLDDLNNPLVQNITIAINKVILQQAIDSQPDDMLEYTPADEDTIAAEYTEDRSDVV